MNLNQVIIYHLVKTGYNLSHLYMGGDHLTPGVKLNVLHQITTVQSTLIQRLTIVHLNPT
jgi:hypothetical protein